MSVIGIFRQLTIQAAYRSDKGHSLNNKTLFVKLATRVNRAS